MEQCQEMKTNMVKNQTWIVVWGEICDPSSVWIVATGAFNTIKVLSSKASPHTLPFGLGGNICMMALLIGTIGHLKTKKKVFFLDILDL